MQKLMELSRTKDLSAVGKLAAKMLSVLEDENPSIEEATAAADIVYYACKNVRNTIRFKDAVLSHDAAEFHAEEMTKKCP